MRARSIRSSLVCLLVCCGVLDTACYTRHAPIDEATLPAFEGTALPLSAGVVVSSTKSVNAQRIHPPVVVEHLADELAQRRVFERVVFPYGPLSDVRTDLELEVLVGSHVDQRFFRNLFKQAAVGASLLVLQPLLPIEYDLEVEILARGRFDGGPWEIEHRASRTRRLSYTWLQVSEMALRDWSRQTAEEATVLLAEQLASDPALRRRAGRGERPPAP